MAMIKAEGVGGQGVPGNVPGGVAGEPTDLPVVGKRANATRPVSSGPVVQRPPAGLLPEGAPVSFAPRLADQQPEGPLPDTTVVNPGNADQAGIFSVSAGEDSPTHPPESPAEPSQPAEFAIPADERRADLLRNVTTEGLQAQANIIRGLFNGEGLHAADTDTPLEREYKAIVAEQSAKARNEVGDLMSLTREEISPVDDGQEIVLTQEARGKVYDYFRSVFKLDEQIEQAKERDRLDGQNFEAAIENHLRQLKTETEIHMIGPVLQIRFPSDASFILFNKLTSDGKSKGVMFPLLLPGSEQDNERLSDNVYVNLVCDEGESLEGQKVDRHELWHAVDAFRYAMFQRGKDEQAGTNSPSAIEHPDGSARFASDSRFKSRLDAYFFDTRTLANSLGQLANDAPEMYRYFFGVDPQATKPINGDPTQQDNAAVLDFEQSFFKIQDELPAFIAGFLNEGDDYPINAKRKLAIINSLISNYTPFGKLDLKGLLARAVPDDTGKLVVDESMIDHTFTLAAGSILEPDPLLIGLRERYSNEGDNQRIQIDKEAYSQDLQKVIDFFLNEGGAGHEALYGLIVNIEKSIDAYKKLVAQRDDHFLALTELSLLPISHWETYAAHVAHTSETKPDVYKHAGLAKETIEGVDVYSLDMSDKDAKEKLANLKEIVQSKRVALEIGPGNQLDSMLFAAHHAHADVVIGIDQTFDSTTITAPSQNASDQQPTVILFNGDIWNSQLLLDFLNTNQEKSQRLAVYSQIVSPDTDNAALLVKLVQGLSNDGFMAVLDSGAVESMSNNNLRDDAITSAILQQEGISDPTQLDWVRYALGNYQQTELSAGEYQAGVEEGRFPHTSFLRDGQMLIIHNEMTPESQDTSPGAEMNPKERLKACARQHGLELTPERMARLLDPSSYETPTGAFRVDGLYIEPFIVERDSEVVTEGVMQFSRREETRFQNWSEGIRALQDYLLLIESGQIENPPDILWGVTDNKSIISTLTQRLGFQKEEMGLGTRVWASLEEISQHIFDKALLDRYESALSKLGHRN